MEQQINSYIRYLQNDKKKTYNTTVSYKRDLDKMVTYLKQAGVDSFQRVTQTDLTGYILELQQNGQSSSTVSRYISSIKSFFAYLFKCRLIEENPADNLKAPKVEKKNPQVMSVNDVVKLLEAPEGDSPKAYRDKAMLELLYATGIKVSELIALKLSDINLQLGFITCSSGSNERVVPFGSEAKQAIMQYYKNGRPFIVKDETCALVFTNVSGEAMSRQGFWKLIKAYSEKAGIETEINPYTLRHSFAAHMIENGADLRSVSEMLGHSDISATKAYAGFANAKIREVYSKAHPRR